MPGSSGAGTITTGEGTLTVTGETLTSGAGVPVAGTLTVITGENVISCNCGGAGQAGARLIIGTGQPCGDGVGGLKFTTPVSISSIVGTSSPKEIPTP